MAPPRRVISAALAINMTTARSDPGRLEELLRQEIAPTEESPAIARPGRRS